MPSCFFNYHKPMLSGTFIGSMQQRRIAKFFLAGCLYFLWVMGRCIVAGAQIQSPLFPKEYYRLNRPAAELKQLRKMIGDSVAAGHMKEVPARCRQAIALAKSCGADTLIPVLYQFLGDAYDGSHSDSAALYYRKALSGFKNPSITKKIYLQQSLIYSYTALNENDSILAYIHALEQTIAPLRDTDKHKLIVMNTLATSYGALNNYAQAIQAFRFVIRNALAIKDTGTLVNALINTATSYNETGNDTLAVYYTRQALPYLRSNTPVKLLAYGNLCDFYSGLGKTDSAGYYLAKAEKLPAAADDEETKIYLGLRRASLLVNAHRYAAATPLLDDALKFYEQLPEKLDLINTLFIYVQLDTGMHEYIRARDHLQRLYKITQGKSAKAYASYTLQLMSIVQEKLGDYKAAYTYQQQYIALNDAIKSDRAAQNFALLQTEYQTFRKEEQIRQLNKEGRIKDLELQEAHRARLWYTGLAVFLCALFAGAYYLRQQRNKAALTQLKSSLEMKALRSQMNPHFIFNSLNSIQKYIWENKQEDAAEYLTRFARLIRLVLENSQHEAVPLSGELAALRLYIDMEHRRNNQKFDYSITVADGVNAEDTLVPPLLIQPYAENAIWHGLSQKEEQGLLIVSVAQEGGFLIYTITDNGIGRAKAAGLRSATIPKASLGMNISSERIAWLRRDSSKQASVIIKDLFNGPQAAGTSVVISLPLILKA